jgi:uncharacterized protein (TIGR04168 family)
VPNDAALTRALRLGVIGDVHLLLDQTDVEQLDARGYDALLFVGDLAAYTHRRGLGVARAISRLRTRAFVIPGNHDAGHAAQMAAEVLEANLLLPLLHVGHEARRRELASALGSALFVGYSTHRLDAPWGPITLVAARPHSAGGRHLAFRPHLAATFGVRDLEASAARLASLVDASESDELIFLAHNGPTGLGAEPHDPWGCDFRAGAGDFGDPDLRAAIDHALRCGKRVRAVVAGHMHHRLRSGGQRVWRALKDGVLHVNAARVPRIFGHEGRTLRHHVELVVTPDRVEATEVLLEGPRT